MSNQYQYQYQYRPLTTTSTVRLIKLENSKTEDRIAFKIRYTEQSTAEYDALSYLWGDPAPTREILISNEDDHEWTSFYVHENLWQFLDNAWQRKMFDRWIWTDRICLNQNDEEEKNEQIPRMAGIYHNAVRVIAWLGLSVSQERYLTRIRDDLKAGTIRKHYSMYSKDEARAAFALYSAEYWERVWVLQEIVSAKEIDCFICNMDMTFREVGMIPPFWSYHLDPASSGSTEAILLQKVVRRQATAPTDGCAPKIDLWQLLSLSSHKGLKTQRLKSQRPHDRVYGLLSLAQDFSDGTSPLSYIDVDYSKPPADAFLDVILESRPDLGSSWPYKMAIDLLLERPENTTIWEPIFTFLSRYTESDRTSQRHRELTKLVLSVSDALYLLASISDSLPGNGLARQAFGKLVSSLNIYPAAGRTAYLYAAVFGVALALQVEESELQRQIFEDWEACRHTRAVASSPWRCAAHQLPSARTRPQLLHIYGPSPHSEELESLVQGIDWRQTLTHQRGARVERTELKWTLGLERPFEKVCGGFKDLQSSGPCEGSLLSCQFPGADLWLQVSIHEDSDGFWRTNWIHVVFSRFWPWAGRQSRLTQSVSLRPPSALERVISRHRT